jgi:exosortase B
MINGEIITKPAWKNHFLMWMPLLAGMLVLYLPTFGDLFAGLWLSESYAHGPIVLVLSLWLMMRKWAEMSLASKNSQGNALGWPICVLALVLYIIGRSQGILIFEVGSFIIMLAGIFLFLWGKEALKVQWFSFLFMLFMIPLPREIVNAVTLPMKTAVSFSTEQIMFLAGYPIARSGVILQIGQYQLMVADACAGLQTLLTLEGLGLFYLNIVRHTSAFRNIALAILIVPIAFSANVIRVILLTLITYYLGDAAGQGYMHKFSGMVLFCSALIFIIAIDSSLHFIVKKRGLKEVRLTERVK